MLSIGCFLVYTGKFLGNTNDVFYYIVLELMAVH